jgi:hypothetical protein
MLLINKIHEIIRSNALKSAHFQKMSKEEKKYFNSIIEWILSIPQPNRKTIFTLPADNPQSLELGFVLLDDKELYIRVFFIKIKDIKILQPGKFKERYSLMKNFVRRICEL